MINYLEFIHFDNYNIIIHYYNAFTIYKMA